MIEGLQNMTKYEFNMNFLIRYYPERSKKWKNKLIGLDKFKDIIGNEDVFNSEMQRIKALKEDSLRINLRRGISFEIVAR